MKTLGEFLLDLVMDRREYCFTGGSVELDGVKYDRGDAPGTTLILRVDDEAWFNGVAEAREFGFDAQWHETEQKPAISGQRLYGGSGQDHRRQFYAPVLLTTKEKMQWQDTAWCYTTVSTQPESIQEESDRSLMAALGREECPKELREEIVRLEEAIGAWDAPLCCGDHPAYDIGIPTEDMTIVIPSASMCARWPVDPYLSYGKERVDAWVLRARLLEVKIASGEVILPEFDENGNLVEEEPPAGRTVSTEEAEVLLTDGEKLAMRPHRDGTVSITHLGPKDEPRTARVRCKCMGDEGCEITLPWKGCGEVLCHGVLTASEGGE